MEGRRERVGNEGTQALAADENAELFEFPVCTMNGVGIDRQLPNCFPHRRQLVSCPEDAYPHSVADLVDQLAVGGYSGSLIQAEGDHRIIVLVY